MTQQRLENQVSVKKFAKQMVQKLEKCSKKLQAIEKKKSVWQLRKQQCPKKENNLQNENFTVFYVIKKFTKIIKFNNIFLSISNLIFTL